MKTPPLTWVRAFCEAGRHGSFKLAAESLNLAPSTISHEIRNLEDWVGQPLFDRGQRQIQLTQTGAKLFALIEPAFDTLEQAFVQLHEQTRTSLRVGMLPFFASELVLPNLQRFAAQAAGRSFEICSDIQLDALNAADENKRVDAVVRYAKVSPAGYSSIALTPVSLALVVGTNENSETRRRIKLSSTFEGWGLLEAAGLEVPVAKDEPIVVDNYLSAMRAVEQGVGIGIAVLPLCEPWLSQGRIRLYNDQRFDLEDRYWLVWRQASPNSDVLASLAEHIREEFTLASARY